MKFYMSVTAKDIKVYVQKVNFAYQENVNQMILKLCLSKDNTSFFFFTYFQPISKGILLFAIKYGQQRVHVLPTTSGFMTSSSLRSPFIPTIL